MVECANLTGCRREDTSRKMCANEYVVMCFTEVVITGRGAAHMDETTQGKSVNEKGTKAWDTGLRTLMLQGRADDKAKGIVKEQSDK